MAKITAISSLGWTHYTLYEALPRMKARGFHRIEIASLNTRCFHFNFGSPTPPQLRCMLRQLDLEPVCLTWSPRRYQAWQRNEIDRFVSDFTLKLEHLSKAGIPMMTMHFGERNNRPDQEYQLSNTVEAYNRVGDIAAGLGIRMVLETPHLYSVMPRTDQALWVVNRLTSPNIGVLVDSSHWGIIGYDLDAYFHVLGDRLWHVHLRDSSGADTADRKQQLEMTPGKGTVDFKELAQALDRANYKADVSLEFEYRDMTLEAIEQEFDEGLRHLANAGWELPDSVKY